MKIIPVEIKTMKTGAANETAAICNGSFVCAMKNVSAKLYIYIINSMILAGITFEITCLCIEIVFKIIYPFSFEKCQTSFTVLSCRNDFKIFDRQRLPD